MVKRQIDDTVIDEIISGLAPVDWAHLELFGRMTDAERVLAGMRATDQERAIVREELRRLHPHLAEWQLNMKVLAHFTPIRMLKSNPRHPENY